MITQLSPLLKGLVFHVPLDQESYNPATKRFTDHSGYVNHGTSANVASFVDDRMGQADRAMDFDGSSDYVNCGNVTSLGKTTFSTWFKSSSVNTGDAIVCFDVGAGNVRFNLKHISLQLPILRLASENWRTFDGSFYDYIDGNWHFMILYIHGLGLSDIYHATLSIDLNDIPAGLTSSNNLPTVWGDFCISRSLNGWFDGSIADVRIYNRALTQAERTLLYESYRPKTVIV